MAIRESQFSSVEACRETHVPTAAEVQMMSLPESKLRRMAGAVLKPGALAHKWTERSWQARPHGPCLGYCCSKCHKEWSADEGKNLCLVPDSDTREWPVIVAELLKMVDLILLRDYIIASHTVAEIGSEEEAYRYFIKAEPIEQAEILLRALGVEVPE